MHPLPETPSPTGEDRLREAFEYAASGMALADLDGSFRETNPAYRQILARPEQEIESETILSVTHEQDRAHCEDQLNRLTSGEISSFVVEKRYVRPSGEPVWVRSSFSLLKRDGQPSFIILICNDVTERRRAEQLLLENEKLVVVGQLTSSIAHEINNPLESVLNLLYLAKQADSLEEARQFVLEAEEETQRIAKIAVDTLQFRKEQGTPDRTNLAELILSVLTLFRGKLNQSNIKLQLNRMGSPNLICYPGEIRQILANLIRNAMEAMPDGGCLRVRVRPATDWRSGDLGVRVTIADTGHGMDVATCRRIYEPFFTTKGNDGTGIGLWVTASILAKHRGSMHVRSTQAMGRSGTAFTLIFPYLGAEGKAAGLREAR